MGEKVSHVLHDAFGERMTPPETMAALVKSGRVGRKAKKGFYRYDVKGKPVDTAVYEALPFGATRVPFPEEELRERPVLLFLNEAVRCLEEGILRSAATGTSAPSSASASRRSGVGPSGPSTRWAPPSCSTGSSTGRSEREPGSSPLR